MIHLIMCEFGADRKSAGKAELPANRLEPTLSSMAKYFPDLRLTVYTDGLSEIETGSIPTEVIRVSPPYDKEHPRYGWRCSDHYRAVGLLASTADIAVYMDSDMRAVSDRVRALIPLTERFGICLPASPRLLVSVDGTVGIDADYEIGEEATLGTGFAMNSSPIFFRTNDARGRALLECFLETYERRSTLSMWRAIWKSGIHPYLLPFQWCVCRAHIGIDEPIILHVGQRRVDEYYAKPANLLPKKKRRKWRLNPFRRRRRSRS